MKEVWKDIVGYEGLYQVSNFGNVKSLEKYIVQKRRKYIKKESILKNNESPYGYLYVNLYKNGKGKGFFVHRLVGIAFIPNPLKKPTINHIDGNKKNNCVCNLEWNTYLENNIHANINNLRDFSKRKHKVQQIKDGVVIATFESYKEAYRKTNVRCSNISSVIKGRCKTAGGYSWKRVF